MRRAEKEITDKQVIDKILCEAEVLRLAMCDKGEPYLVAMNYAYADGCLYLHCAQEGRKIDILRKNPKVAFQTDTDVELLVKEDSCSCSMRYLSIFGTGRAVFIDVKEEKLKALDAIMTKHTGKADFKYPDQMLERTLVIKVEVETISGKKSGY